MKVRSSFDRDFPLHTPHDSPCGHRFACCPVQLQFSTSSSLARVMRNWVNGQLIFEIDLNPSILTSQLQFQILYRPWYFQYGNLYYGNTSHLWLKGTITRLALDLNWSILKHWDNVWPLEIPVPVLELDSTFDYNCTRRLVLRSAPKIPVPVADNWCWTSAELEWPNGVWGGQPTTLRTHMIRMRLLVKA